MFGQHTQHISLIIKKKFEIFALVYGKKKTGASSGLPQP